MRQALRTKALMHRFARIARHSREEGWAFGAYLREERNRFYQPLPETQVVVISIVSPPATPAARAEEGEGGSL